MARILDAHLHLWDPSERHYDWLDEQPSLRRRFGPEDVDAGRYELAGAVFVQADCREDEALDEVRWVQRGRSAARARDRRVRAGPPRRRRRAAAGRARRASRSSSACAGCSRARPGEAIARPRLAEGVQLLAERSLTFDLCVSHDQLPAVAQLVEACPDTSFVLDHLGKPPVAAALLDPWRDDIARLAAFPNVTLQALRPGDRSSGRLDERGRAPVPRARARGLRAERAA